MGSNPATPTIPISWEMRQREAEFGRSDERRSLFRGDRAMATAKPPIQMRVKLRAKDLNADEII